MMYADTTACPDPCPYQMLKAALPTYDDAAGVALRTLGDATPNRIAGDNPRLIGFDREVIQLVFTTMLSLPVTFVTTASFANLYAALLDGVCDVAITASQMDPTISACAGPVNLTSATAALFDYVAGDYAAGVPPFGSGGVQSQIDCLQFGAPYVIGGFALLSLVSAAPFDPISALFSPEVCNAATAILIIVCSAGFLVSLLERGNMHLGTPSRGVYWSALTFLMINEEEPRNKAGRIVMIMYLLANIVGLTVLTSIVSAKLTTSALSVTYIMGLSDVSGMLCIESNYGVLLDFVNRSPGKPVSITFGTVDECVDRLVTGDVQAVITDRAVLQWYSNYYGVANSFVGPVLQTNPFAFVYKSDNAALMSYVNPAIIAATQTDADWIPLYSALTLKYFGAGSTGAPPVVLTLVDRRTLYVSLIMLAFAIAYALINGDWGPGISRPVWLRKAIQQPAPMEAMSEEEAALGGDDLAFVRLMIGQMKELRSAIGIEEAPMHGAAKAADAEAPAPAAAAAAPLLMSVLSELRGMRRELAEVRELRHELKGLRTAAAAARDVKAQMHDLKAQLRSQEVLKAQMMEMRQRMLAADGGGRPQQQSAVKPSSESARTMPQLPYWGLDRRT